MLRWILCFFLLLSLFPLSAKAAPVTVRLALLIGNNNGGAAVEKLRYAEQDARKMRHLLQQLGGYQPRHIWLSLGRRASSVQQTLVKMEWTIRKLRKKHGKRLRLVLLVYYSGHAKRGQLLLGSSRLPFHKLRLFLKRVKASLKLVILDACESGGFMKTRGLKRRKEVFAFPAVNVTPSAKGEVIITATGSQGNAHEDPRLRGGIFTHYLLSGLRGAADRNGDGHVTLEEAYLYSYSRSLERTILSRQGPQRARFSKRLSGYGSLVLTTLSRQRAWLQLKKNVSGEFFVWNHKRDLLLAEVVKSRGKRIILALSPGRYVLQWRRYGGVFHKTITLSNNQRFVLQANGRRLAYHQGAVPRGGPVATVSGDGYQALGEEMLGFGVAASYRMSLGMLTPGLQQGGQFSFLWTLEKAGAPSLTLVFQVGYQYGFSPISDKLKVDQHFADFDIGLLWTLMRRSFLWWGLGGVVRTHSIFQSVQSNAQRARKDLLSFSGGPALLSSLQWGLPKRFFVQANVLAGLRLINLGGEGKVLFDGELTLGIGRRF